MYDVVSQPVKACKKEYVLYILDTVCMWRLIHRVGLEVHLVEHVDPSKFDRVVVTTTTRSFAYEYCLQQRVQHYGQITILKSSELLHFEQYTMVYKIMINDKEKVCEMPKGIVWSKLHSSTQPPLSLVRLTYAFALLKAPYPSNITLDLDGLTDRQCFSDVEIKDCS
ncbi:hypothetical protein NQ317_013950 [Molorchus minor]|uniref:Uncharacterized protein n=1 Tax=Molorchus minor TaxID=1323400 RepID=A0ABQ9JV07_9CUCU|nr:hypothetical protein NQ317_013950 [Molorchus minor]